MLAVKMFGTMMVGIIWGRERFNISKTSIIQVVLLGAAVILVINYLPRNVILVFTGVVLGLLTILAAILIFALILRVINNIVKILKARSEPAEDLFTLLR